MPVRALATLVLSGVLAVAAACGSVQSYQGATRPAGEVAVLVPDGPRLRAMSAFPAAPDGCSGQVFLRVGNCGLTGLDQRFQVLPGQHTLEVIFQDKNAPGTGKELSTESVSFPVTVAAGREYRIRGLSLYTPPKTWEARSLPMHTRYRVRLIAQDTQSGQIVHWMEVPGDKIKPLE